MRLQKFFVLFIIIGLGNAQVKWKIVSSNQNELIIHLESKIFSLEDLKPIDILIGLPSKTLPKLQIQAFNESNHNFAQHNTIFQTEWIYSQKVNDLNTGTLRLSPIKDLNSFYESIIIKIPFEESINKYYRIETNHHYLLAPKIVNWNMAKNWIKPEKKNLLKENTLPDGNWVRFYLSKDGFYKISGKDLKSVLQNQNSLDPRSIMLYTGSALGRDRTFEETQVKPSNRSIPNNLIELPIRIIGESDGNLSDDDIIIFYGRGPSGFNEKNNKVNWQENLYFNESVYWLLIPSNNSLRGDRVETSNLVAESSEKINYGMSYIHYEKDLINPRESGLSWGDKIIEKGNSYSFNMNIPFPIESKDVNSTIGMIGNEKVPTAYQNTKHQILLSLNDQELTTMDWPNLNHKLKSFSFNSDIINNENQSFKIVNTSENPNSEPLFDYLTISYNRILEYSKPFYFYSPFKSKTITFVLTGSDLFIWNISNPSSPKNLPLNSFQNSITMNTDLPSDEYQKFGVYAVDDLEPISELTFVGPKKWDQLRSNLNGVDHLILGPKEFEIQSQQLINHRNNSRYVSIESIYDEFSGGSKDPIAIRYFLNWTQQNWLNKPYTVLFMGDADYDYRNITGQSIIKVPTIQVGTRYSHSTDDRLVSFNGIIPEMATGRVPAKSNDDVNNFINKIIEFENKLPMGLWRQRITLVADDPARPERELFELTMGKSHTINSERLAKIIPDFIETKKIYMVDFPEVLDNTTFGVTKPAATQALFNEISAGTAIINFIGHGNPTQWAQEKLLIINEDRNDINSMHAELKLPIWIAGTCSWGQFDAIGQDSFAEELINSSINAAAGVITTTRGITVSSNIQYLEKIFREIFKGDSVTYKSIGSILQSVKTGSSDGELFHFFGDPAMKISIPTQLVKNSKVSPDTLSTLSVGTLSAESPFLSGKGYFILEDGYKEVKKMFNYASRQEEISYQMNGAILFRGSFNYENKILSSQFRVPKDISYSKNPATLRFNVTDNSNLQALGSVTGIKLALGPPSNDTQGPIISFETENGRNLLSGDFLKTGESIVVRISDPLGINLTGEKGHEMILTNNSTQVKTNITNKFIYDMNSINTGTFLINDLPDSDEISFRINAWDNANNPSESEIRIKITNSDELSIFNLFNFPNPISMDTKFSFELTANAEVSINIYSLDGRRIKRILPKLCILGHNNIYWDGKDEFGQIPANGAYLYKLTAKNSSHKIDQIGRLAIYR